MCLLKMFLRNENSYSTKATGSTVPAVPHHYVTIGASVLEIFLLFTVFCKPKANSDIKVILPPLQKMLIE